jgi:hypothetical protein
MRRAAGLAETAVEEVCGGDDETARDDERGVCSVRFFDYPVCEDNEEESGGEGQERKRAMVVAQVSGQERNDADDDGDAEHEEFYAFIAKPRDADERQHAEQDRDDRAVNGAGAGCQHAEAVKGFGCSGSSGFQVKSPMKFGWGQFSFLVARWESEDFTTEAQSKAHREPQRKSFNSLCSSVFLCVNSVPPVVSSYA